MTMFARKPKMMGWRDLGILVVLSWKVMPPDRAREASFKRVLENRKNWAVA